MKIQVQSIPRQKGENKIKVIQISKIATVKDLRRRIGNFEGHFNFQMVKMKKSKRNSTSTKGKNQQRIVLTNCSDITVLEDDAQTIGSLKFTDEYILAIQKTDLESQNPSSGSQTTTKGSTYNSEEEEKINKKDQSSNMG